MNNLDKAKEVIAENVKNAQYGIFNTPNTMGDHMNVLYSNDEIKILICYYYEYFEVFGLSEDEFEDLENFYIKLIRSI